jgi:hypothetical protein
VTEIEEGNDKREIGKETKVKKENVHKIVREGYAEIAKQSGSC